MGPRSVRFGAGVAALLLLAAACGGDERESTNTTEASVETTVATTGQAGVKITEPADGATVTNPVKVTMSASEFTIEPAGPPREGAGHFHVMVDVGCVKPGDQIPLETPGYNHFGKAQTEASLELAPGEHTLCLQAGDGSHKALELTDEIRVTVAS